MVSDFKYMLTRLGKLICELFDLNAFSPTFLMEELELVERFTSKFLQAVTLVTNSPKKL